LDVATDLMADGHGPHADEPRHDGRRRFHRGAAIAALIIGALGFVVSAAGLAIAVLPRHFTAGQQQQIVAWQVGGRWRAMPAGQIFPASVQYTLPSTVIQAYPPLELQAERVAIAPQAACTMAAMTDAAAVAVLRKEGCAAVLRATYIDQTSSFVVTVGVAVFASTSAATAASGDLARPALAAERDSGPVPAGVRTVHFTGPAGVLYDYSRQISAAVTAGPYLVMYAAGYSDGRPRVPLAHDSYSQAEMSSVAQGVASSVASGLGAQPPAPHCPGSPGC
jgi:hypothetical protein